MVLVFEVLVFGAFLLGPCCWIGCIKLFISLYGEFVSCLFIGAPCGIAILRLNRILGIIF